MKYTCAPYVWYECSDLFVLSFHAFCRSRTKPRRFGPYIYRLELCFCHLRHCTFIAKKKFSSFFWFVSGASGFCLCCSLYCGCNVHFPNVGFQVCLPNPFEYFLCRGWLFALDLYEDQLLIQEQKLGLWRSYKFSQLNWTFELIFANI